MSRMWEDFAFKSAYINATILCLCSPFNRRPKFQVAAPELTRLGSPEIFICLVLSGSKTQGALLAERAHKSVQGSLKESL